MADDSDVVQLVYLDRRGRAEVARLMLSAAGVPFQDVRVANVAEAAALLRPRRLPYGQLPVMLYRGRLVSQSMAINRLLARELDMYGGGSALDAARVDEVCEGVADLLQAFYVRVRRFANKPDERAQFVAAFAASDLPHHLGAIDALLRENAGGDAFFVGQRLSLADVLVFVSLSMLDQELGGTLFPAFDRLAAHHRRVAAVPGIADWLRRRPPQATGGGTD